LKTLIIAEKPSVAREIMSMLAQCEGEKWSKKGGYAESQNYLCSHFFGHLLESYEPGDYDQKWGGRWNVESLPISVSSMKFKYKKTTAKQGKLLAKLSLSSSNIINATDPDREGEGIFRTWYNYEKISNPVKRFWSHSTTFKDLQKAWKKLAPSSEYDNFANAQNMRSTADWLIGMNATRAYSVLSGNTMHIGRVKTPTLALIVNRDREVENYKESFTFSLKGIWQGLTFTYIDDDGKTKFDNESELKALKEKISNSIFTLSDFDRKRKKQNPPETFSMPALQKTANKMFDFPLDKTLTLTQSLYEKKLVTYPRTDSPCLPESDLMEYYDLLDALANDDQKKLLKHRGEKPRCVKNTDAPHTAIIPTGETMLLSGDEEKLYSLIKERFIVAFMKPRAYDEITVKISEGNSVFRSIAKVTVEKGYTDLYTEEKKSDDEADEVGFINEDKLKSAKEKIENLATVKIKAAKPKYFTPATLITAMMNAGKSIEEKEMKDVLKEVDGLGTSATRDQYPKQLLEGGYISKKGKSLISTQKGRTLIDNVHSTLKSPEMTARWELKLKDIERGKYSPKTFKDEIDALVHDVIRIDTSKMNAMHASIEADKNSKFLCPKCGKTMRKLKWGIGCAPCKFGIAHAISGKTISEKCIEQLLNKKETDFISGFKKKDNKGTFTAKLILDANYKVSFCFESKKSNLSCPKCQSPMKEFSRGIKCTDSEKCGFILWDNFCSKKLNASHMQKLLSERKTDLIKGFVSPKNGKKFDAFLVLQNDGKIKMEF